MANRRGKKDVPGQLAFDAGTNPVERQHALVELTKSHLPHSADLIPDEKMRPLIEYITNDLEEQALAKASAKVIQFPRGRRRDGSEGMRSVYLDDFTVNIMGDWFEKPGTLGFDQQRMMVEQTPILNAIVLTRVRQIQRFCNPLEQDDGPGFQIRHVDKDHKVTASEREEMRLLGRFFTNCGWEFNPRKRLIMKRDSFPGFMAKLVRDSLTMDSAPIETEFKREAARGIDGFYAVDGASIRLCTEQGYQGDDQIYALQVIGGMVRTTYNYNELIYQPRNPLSDVSRAGYGLSETELLVRVVTGFLNAMSLNIKGFSDNSIPRGLLQLVGDYSNTDLNAFKRHWNAMTKGVHNAWALPVMVSSDKDSKAEFVPIDSGFSEMYFSKWMTFLTSIACAIHQMSPEEINFGSFTDGKASLSGDDTAEKIAHSTDKGLRTTLSYFEGLLSDYICSEFSDKYVFRWAGLEEQDQEKKHEKVKLVATVDEMRHEVNMPAHPDPKIGGAPVNPALMPLYQESQQQQNEDGLQGDFGQPPPGEEGDGFNEAAEGESEEESEQDRSNGKIRKAALPAPYRLGWSQQ